MIGRWIGALSVIGLIMLAVLRADDVVRLLDTATRGIVGVFRIMR